MGYSELVEVVTRYFATNGSLSDTLYVTQLVAAHAVQELRDLLNIIEGSI